jgi:4-hydroxy-2-oxoheptanedioate aldolase
MSTDRKPLMQTPTNPFKTALTQPRPLVGVWSMLNSATAVEALSGSGFDWILLDGEHSPLELRDAIEHLRALNGGTTLPIVRLPDNDPILFKRFLDAGATTIMLPQVQSAAEAKAAVSAMRYAPAGARGVALMHRASRYGRVPNYLQTANEGLCLIVQIETPAALDNLEEIASVDGVDALFFGPGDLSASMGVLGQPDHPKVQEAIAAALERASRVGVPAGVLAPNPAAAQRYLEMGFAFVSVANDLAMLVHTADATAARYREMAAGCKNKHAAG